jgi:hypothetical protein
MGNRSPRCRRRKYITRKEAVKALKIKGYRRPELFVDECHRHNNVYYHINKVVRHK